LQIFAFSIRSVCTWSCANSGCGLGRPRLRRVPWCLRNGMARPAKWMRTLAQLKLPRVSPHALRYWTWLPPPPARVADNRPCRIRPSIQQHRRPGPTRTRPRTAVVQTRILRWQFAISVSPGLSHFVDFFANHSWLRTALSCHILKRPVAIPVAIFGRPRVMPREGAI
jgi:hypothetical protein